MCDVVALHHGTQGVHTHLIVRGDVVLVPWHVRLLLYLKLGLPSLMFERVLLLWSRSHLLLSASFSLLASNHIHGDATADDEAAADSKSEEAQQHGEHALRESSGALSLT